MSEGAVVANSSGGWSLKDVDLTAYSGERVRIGFLHSAGTSNVSPGWYVDDKPTEAVVSHQLSVISPGPGANRYDGCRNKPE